MRGEEMRALLRHSIAMLTNWRLVLIHLIVNAALLVSASLWLLIPDEHVWQLAFAALSALLIAVVFLWLHGATLAYGTDPEPANLRPALSIKPMRMIWLLIGCFILFWCMRMVSSRADLRWAAGGYFYSKAPSWLRPTSGEGSYVTAVGYIIAILVWYAIPGALLPLIAARVIGGTALRGLRTIVRWQYWVGLALTTLIGVWVASALLGWTPGKTLREQTTSLVIRLIVAYGISTAAWLATAGLLGYFVGTRDDAPSNVVGKAAA
jgi:hypothetical protein